MIRYLNKFSRYSLSALFLAFIALASGCLYTYDEPLADALREVNPQINASDNCYVIDFDTHNPELSHGLLITELYTTTGLGPIQVDSEHPRGDVEGNVAQVFDSSLPDSDDLGSPNEDFGGPGKGGSGGKEGMFENSVFLDNVLIVSRDPGADEPNDEWHPGGRLIFDFTSLIENNESGIRLSYIDILDFQRPLSNEAGYLQILDKTRQISEEIEIPDTGKNGFLRVDIDKMAYGLAVVFPGSGAVDNLAFCMEKHEEVEEGEGCTYSHGYYKQSHHFDAWCEVDPEDDFYESGHDYLSALTTPPKGNAYYILSKRFVTAKLNQCNGASVPDEVADALKDAHMWFEEYTPEETAEWSGGNSIRQKFIRAAGILDEYNNGIRGPGKCTDD